MKNLREALRMKAGMLKQSPSKGAQELEMELMEHPFAVIQGNDHHSFPSAMKNARELGIATVLHFDYGPGGTGVYNDEIRLRRIHLAWILGSLSTEKLDWMWQLQNEEICHFIELPAFFGPIAFATGGLEECTGQRNVAFFREMKSTLREHPEVRLLMIPGCRAGPVGRFGDIQSEMHMPPHPKKHRVKFTGDVMHAFSPGNCRAHTFCVCDWTERSITWHRCG